MSFLQRFGFWIGILTVCVAALLAQFLVIEPMSVNNTKLMEDLDRRRKKLQSFVSAGKRGELRNEAWIKEAKKQADRWEKERKRCEKFFRKQQTLSKVLTDASGKDINAQSRWVSEFRLRCTQVEKGLRNKGIEFEDMIFAFQRHREDYKKRYPRKNEMPKAARALHILEEFIRILSNESAKLAAIDGLKIDDEAKGEAANLADITQEGVFKAHPYALVVQMEFERLLYLMEKLLASKLLDISIERVRVIRPEKAGGDKSNMVTIHLVGRYMDYDIPEANDGEA